MAQGGRMIDKPNYTQIPNVVLDDMMACMGDAEFKVVMAVARQTFGYHRKRHNMSLTDLCAMTGLSRQGVINGVTAGMERGVIDREVDGNSWRYAIVIDDSPSQRNRLVNEVDQPTSQPNGLPVVNEVDQASQRSRPELVNEVDQNTPVLKKEKETIKDITEKEEDTRTRDPLTVAWQQAYADIEMPPKLASSLKELAAECSIAAAIHGIKASAANPDGRNFKYIAECARNYVPPSRTDGKATYGNTYVIDLPGVVALEPAAEPSAPVLPAPMAHDDPWAIALKELRMVLPGSAPHWLEDSILEENGELAGVPFYRIVMVTPGADAGWMMRQVEPAVRRKLGSLLGKRITIEFVAEHEMEVTG